MITFSILKHFVENAFDLEELMFVFLLIPFTIILDIVCILLQPIFIIAYIMWNKNNRR